MTTEYFTADGNPSTGSAGSSAAIRAQQIAIEAGFAKLPTLAGNGSKNVRVNAGATALEASGALTSSETFALSGDISPAQIVADTNDYAPTGLSTASVLRLTTDASRNITGLTGGSDGRILLIHNVGSFNIVLVDESVSSAAANRFALSANLTISPDTGVSLQYDSTGSRWRMVGLPSAAGVDSFSAGTTGFTPNTATTGAVTLAGTLAIANGGTAGTTAAAARASLDVPTRTGGDASGTWGISISGNAASATTAAACSGNAATATTAAACSGNAATVTTVTTGQVNGAIAGSAVGAVGTYAFLYAENSGAVWPPGTNVAAANLYYASIKSDLSGIATDTINRPAGTWKLVGRQESVTNALSEWLRIS